MPFGRLPAPEAVEVEQETLTRPTGKFVAQPFRAWATRPRWQRPAPQPASSIEGAAITGHPDRGCDATSFCLDPGVKEDVTTSS